MISKIRDRMDAFADKMAKVQSKIFLTVFYFTLVPIAYSYLSLRGKNLRKTTGYFQEPEHDSNELEDHLKQY